MAYAEVTWLKSQFERSWLKALAPKNMASVLVTFDMFQLESDWLNFWVVLKTPPMF